MDLCHGIYVSSGGKWRGDGIPFFVSCTCTLRCKLSFTILCVSGVVAVLKQATWLSWYFSSSSPSISTNVRTALSTALLIKLNGNGCWSPSCRSRPTKLMVFLSSRAGVPVCRRPSAKPAEARDAESPVEGASPILPAGKRLRPTKNLVRLEKGRLWDAPTCISPDRNVPVHITTCEQSITSPESAMINHYSRKTKNILT